MTTLSKHLNNKKMLIFSEVIQLWEQQPQSAYRDFLIHTPEGRDRIKLWIDMIINSLEGNQQTLFDDQREIGYIRAVQGHNFAHTSTFYPMALTIFTDLLVRISDKDKISFFDDCLRLMKYYLQAYKSISNSYMDTREEIIQEKVFYLEELYAFTKDIISTQNLEMIVEMFLKKIRRLLKIENCYFLLSRNGIESTVHSYPLSQPSKSIFKIMEKSYNENTILCKCKNGVESLMENIDKPQKKKLVALPVELRDQIYGVIALTGTKPFVFTSKEFNLLTQFLYIVTITLDGAFMFREIEQSHHQLRFLAEKMINVQEEERKRIASDIHDSVAQKLASIGYKIEYCKELMNNPEILSNQLEILTEMVNNTISQSRDMISTLRPVLIDTVGIVAAIKRLLKNFISETNILVESDLPSKIEIKSSLSICVYRVLQEALANIYKHSSATSSKVVLKERNGVLLLTISDNGKGFNMSTGLSPMANQNKLGLIFMKERVEAAGGHFSIHSSIGKGCGIEISIPLNEETCVK